MRRENLQQEQECTAINSSGTLSLSLPRFETYPCIRSKHGDEDTDTACAINHTAQDSIEYKENEKLVVLPPHTIDDPRAVVVHFQRASVR